MSKEQTGRNGSDKNAVTVGSLTPVKVSVPNTNLHLAGILQSTNHSSRRLGIICHGSLGHKNYLFQPTLANALAPYMDTFRFDFRGNGESDGQMGYSNWNDDLADIDAVISHFERQGYYIYALIGHSRGAISALNYAANFNHMPMIPYIISISSRFNMADVRRKHGPELMTLLENQGHFEWHARSAGKEITLRVTQQHFDDFVNLDTASVIHIPTMTNILLCHGSDDEVVPVRDIADLHSHLSHARTTLRIINRADHNYKKHYKELSEMVAHYFSAEGRKQEWSRRVLPNWKTWVHAVEGVLNFRTVGDIWIPSKEDGTVSYLRPGIIYRSADVSKPTPEGIKTMEALNITDTFDLRSNSEIERRGTFDTGKIRRHHTPVFSEVDYSPAQIALRFSMYLGGTEGFANAYMSMLPNIKQFLPPILEHIVNKRTPFIVHCTAGKDRTGVVCALLQMICGVDEEQIAWEYELTRRCMAIKEEDVRFLKAALGEDTTDAKVRGILSAKEEYMFRFLEQFHAKYGTITDFLANELEMTMEQIDAVRNALLVKIPVPRAVL
ncbi:protein-tyrosine phosphatase-like protein [Lobosporangium transversale]|uniref:Protein-tyrosine phosphatase-like protein n=1 Tax=Lobosporangium transversale TaxID=64571 RepID=A0A1Y2G8A8_9FUNG|nr:protein-tyrosine phosphatase-like protein [Lobosporangium transversale]ORZ04073.1 protein-tyrosine phosphatase-like protein [Lobosporangium transversale]|eukprot:XP_021876350.1 protein-tyrosine phosphatase-like protein [Lobosporangium transversale]